MEKTLRDKLNNIPELPGIYKMIDSNGRIIYIGKSICLKKRVKSYFTGSSKLGKVERMVGLIKDVEYKVMDTHLEARLEECKLIKELKPIFNSQYKNHNKYVYLKVEDYNIHNSLSISYERIGNCHGPFKSMSFVMELIDSLKNLYPIVKIADKYDFDYNLIPKSMDKNTFNKNRNSLSEILSDREILNLFINRLEAKMTKASSLLKFETASYYKDLICNLNYVKKALFAYKEMFIKDIILKLDIEDGYKLFYISQGKIISKQICDKLEDKTIDGFINKSKKLINLNSNYIDEEKINMDFKEILYSEIKSLPQESIIILES